MHPMRRIVPPMLACTLALVPTAVLAHTDFASSDPADGAVLVDPPTEVVVTFTGELGDGSSFVVTGPDGETVGEGEIDLDEADRNVLRGETTITEPGNYVVTYSATAADGHPAEGEVTFTYDPDGSAGGDDEESTPDTAILVAGGSGGGAALVGVLLLVLATLVGARRVVTRRA